MKIFKDLKEFYHSVYGNSQKVFGFHYIEKENVVLDCKQETFSLTDLNNAMKVGKNVDTYIFQKKDSTNSLTMLSMYLEWAVSEEMFIDFLYLLKKACTEPRMSNSIPFKFSEEFVCIKNTVKGTSVFSPFSEVKAVNMGSKWTAQKVAKGILSKQIFEGETVRKLTDDYKSDSDNNFGKDDTLDLLDFAQSIYESPTGWRVYVDENKSTFEYLVLSVNCYHFDSKEVKCLIN